MKTLTFLCVVVLLNACQLAVVTDVKSPYYSVPTGSRLVLHVPLSIPPHTAGVYLQYGKVVDYELLDVYYPNCRLEVSTVTDVVQTVHPDTFVISKVIDDTELVQTKPIILAAAPIGASFYVSTRIRSGGGLTAEIYSTEFWLLSKSQPDVLRMACQHWEDAHFGNYLTVDQIRTTLGKVFTLELAINN